MSAAAPAPGTRPVALLYVAYPLSLTLQAANAVQTFQTMRHLAAQAPARDATVTLVIPRWLREPSRFAEALGPAVRHLPRIPINKLTRFWKASAFSYLERTAWSAQLLAWLGWRRLTGRGFAAIYVRDSVVAYWLLRARALAGAPIVYEVHDLEQTNPSAARGAGLARWRRAIDRVTIRRPARLVSLTATFRAFLAARGLRPAADVDVIPDAYDADRYPGMAQAAARAALGLPPDAFIAGYAGLTFAYRRLDLLVAAFAAAAAQAPAARPWRLVLAGGRPAEVAALRAQAADLGLPVAADPADIPVDAPAAVLLPGQVPPDAVAPYLYAADVLVIPDTVTTLTASPLKLFEYMAAGRPIVLRELPALREILGDDALYFPPGDAAALAAALTRLAAAPDLAARLGAAAARAAAGYTYAERARRVLDTLLRVARG